MEYNDISIDVTLAYSSLNKITKSMETIIKLSNVIMHNAKLVGRSFDTVNYQKALQILQSVNSELVYKCNNVNKLKEYFRKLQDAEKKYKNSKASKY